MFNFSELPESDKTTGQKNQRFKYKDEETRNHGKEKKIIQNVKNVPPCQIIMNIIIMNVKFQPTI